MNSRLHRTPAGIASAAAPAPVGNGPPPIACRQSSDERSRQRRRSARSAVRSLLLDPDRPVLDRRGLGRSAPPPSDGATRDHADGDITRLERDEHALRTDLTEVDVQLIGRDGQPRPWPAGLGSPPGPVPADRSVAGATTRPRCTDPRLHGGRDRDQPRREWQLDLGHHHSGGRWHLLHSRAMTARRGAGSVGRFGRT